MSLFFGRVFWDVFLVRFRIQANAIIARINVAAETAMNVMVPCSSLCNDVTAFVGVGEVCACT